MKRLLALFFILLASNAYATDWYFDKDSIGGTCSDTGSGTISAPFCSPLNKIYNLTWNGAQAGDTIYLRGGTYSGLQFKITATRLVNGTPSNPITIRPYPGETVIFDGGGTTPLLFDLYNTVHDLHFIGPFEAKGYWKVLDFSSLPTTESARTSNLVFDNWTVHDGSMGFLFRAVNNITVRNSTFYNLKGNKTHIEDNVIGVSVRGNTTMAAPYLHSDNILIENCVAHDINDGKGNDNGDADGFHTDQYVDTVTLKNLTAYNCSEDGVDTKAQTVVMENIVSHHNGATGIKLWGGGQGRTSTFDASRVLTYGNTETGLKCTGWTDDVTANIDNLTAWGNGEDNLKNTTGIDDSSACTVNLRNSLLGQAGINSVVMALPREGYFAKTYFDHVNITHGGSSVAVNVGCSDFSGKYSTTQYVNGTYTGDLSVAHNCAGTVYGTIQGAATSPVSSDPLLTSAPPVFEWASIATAEITGNTLTLVTEASYPWPSPVVGHYIEINDDGVKREITGIGDSTTRTISFYPSVSSGVCGRATDCRGVRVVGWADNAALVYDYRLQSTSNARDSGLYVAGKHCAQADDAGGSELAGCIHWRGTSPDLGYAEWTPPGRRYRYLTISGD